MTSWAYFNGPDLSFDNDLMVTEFEELFGSCSYSDFPPDLTRDPGALLDWLFQLEMTLYVSSALTKFCQNWHLFPRLNIVFEQVWLNKVEFG